VAVGKPQQQHKKQAGKAPPAVATADLDLQLQEEEDLLKGIDMTLLHRSASFHSLYFIYFCAKIVTCCCDPKPAASMYKHRNIGGSGGLCQKARLD